MLSGAKEGVEFRPVTLRCRVPRDYRDAWVLEHAPAMMLPLLHARSVKVEATLPFVPRVMRTRRRAMWVAIAAAALLLLAALVLDTRADRSTFAGVWMLMVPFLLSVVAAFTAWHFATGTPRSALMVGAMRIRIPVPDDGAAKAFLERHPVPEGEDSDDFTWGTAFGALSIGSLVVLGVVQKFKAGLAIQAPFMLAPLVLGLLGWTLASEDPRRRGLQTSRAGFVIGVLLTYMLFDKWLAGR
jgi:hypothetical protein